ncbi:MAG: hypothetical protein JO212_00695 [Acetobacteraceae bacterium]|nr:hypothetical protein [Acetobacteraceae bacterium]
MPTVEDPALDAFTRRLLSPKVAPIPKMRRAVEDEIAGLKVEIAPASIVPGEAGAAEVG